MKIDSVTSKALGQAQLAEEEAREISRKAEERRNNVKRDADRSVLASETESESRLKVAQLHAANTAREAEAELEKMRENYGRELSAESGRNERSLITEKNKGESLVRSQVAENNRNLHRTKRDYEAYRTQLDENHKTQMQFKETQHRRELQQELGRQGLEKDAIKTQGDQGLAMLKQSYDQETRRLSEDLNQKQVAMNDFTRGETERMEQNMVNNSRLMREQHEARYAAHIAAERAEVEKVAGEAMAQKDAIRRANAMDVAQYSTKQADPFYRHRELQSTMSENDQEYSFVANIPQHEQNNVSVIVRDNSLVLTGYRESNESDQKPNGERTESHGYQTFRKSYDLAMPVETRMMRKEFVGDELRVILPKKTGASAIAAGRPNFVAKTGKGTPRA